MDWGKGSRRTFWAAVATVVCGLVLAAPALGDSITGRVTAFGTGQPVTDCELQLWYLDGDGTSWYRAGVYAAPGADGNYSLGLPGNGSYRVQCYNSTAYSDQWWREVPNPTFATTITVPGGAVTGIDFSLHLKSAAAAPTVAGFSPASGPVGSRVVLSGTDLTGATAVDFHGTRATVFTVDSATQISATVPDGATTGAISVSTPGGTATTSTSFIVVSAPTITGFTPAAGAVGASVTITGVNLSGASAVAFNGKPAAFTAQSASQIQATVPAGATTGRISVTTPGGTATSAGIFTVYPKPVVSRLSPTSGKRGVALTITGKALGAKRGTGYVKFGATRVSRYVSWSNTRIKVRVPAKARFGRLKVVVVTAGGASNARTFTVRR